MCGFLVTVEPLLHSGTMFHAVPAIAITEHFHSDLYRRDAGQSRAGWSPSHTAALIMATSVT